MSLWEDEEEDNGNVPEFDPAESPVRKHDPKRFLHIELIRKFIENYNKEYPGQINDTEKLLKDSFGKNFMITEHYVEKIIRHYYKSELPYEDDLEPVDINSYPDNKELKRFLKRNGYSIDWDAIDR